MAPNGDGAAFNNPTNFAGESGSLAGQYVSRRTADGWETEGISPPMDPTIGLGVGSQVPWMSPDLSQALVTTYGALNPGDPDGEASNLYLRDGNAHSFTTITPPGPPAHSRSEFKAVSGGGRHVLYIVERSFNDLELWLWDNGLNHFIAPLTSKAYGVNSDAVSNNNQVSFSGTRTFYADESVDEENFGRKHAGLYVYEKETEVSTPGLGIRAGR